ncbi:MAG: DUF3800 domain-containing protein [Thermodesulfobacteriota bacterium]
MSNIISAAVGRAALAVRWIIIILSAAFKMYIFYLDDSGSVPNLQEQNLVLGGISVYERHTYWFTQQLDTLASQIDSSNPQGIEFHASEIFSGRIPPWDRFPKKDDRINIIKNVLKIVRNSFQQNNAFACVIHKPSYPTRDPMEMAFEDLCSRFNLHLSRLYASTKQKEKGLIVLDESSYETSLQKMATGFRCSGTRWGNLRDLAEVPLFANSKASRLIQVADHIAYAVFRRYESGDTSYLDLILSKFDSANGILHGLAHKTIEPNCMCPACMSRSI